MPTDSSSTDVSSLLFLPGASGNVDLWKPVAERFRHPGAHRFLGWPGFGDTPTERDVNCFDDLVARVVREISGPVDLLAQSMGGVVAIRAALERPGLIRHLVLAVTSGGIDMSAFGALDWRKEFREQNPAVPDWFQNERSDLTARLPGVTVPVLLLWGDSDPISPVAVGERLAEIFPVSELVVIEGGAHDLVQDRADEVAPLVDRHLQCRG